jgi:tRNA nucleotidyltransferase/poly(A) polymerase
MKTPTMLDQLVTQPIVKKILQVLPKTAEIFIVGGAVRDVLLERPITDLDFVIRHIPIAELQKSLSVFGEVNEKGLKWGVLTVALDGESIDVALPRKEQGGENGAYHETSAAPDLELPIETDLKRRDFTINAMAVNARTGELVDPYHGKVDTLQKMLRTIGNPETRFAEDHSRILRCLRLAAQLGFAIEPITWEGLRTVVQTAGQLRVPKRIWEQEFAKAQTDLPTFHELLRKAGIEKIHV